MSRVRAGFFDARTRPTGPPPLPGPGPFNKRVLFLAPNLPRRVFTGPTGPVQPLLGLIHGPIQPNLIIYIFKKKNTHTHTHTHTQTQIATQINQHCVTSLAEMRFLDRK